MNDLIRVSEAATVYGCDRRRIYQLISEGKLKKIEKFGLILVKKSKVIELSLTVTPRGVPRKGKM